MKGRTAGGKVRGAAHLVDHEARKQASLVKPMQDAPQRPERSTKTDRTGSIIAAHDKSCRRP
jgi:hypothetical protein